MIQTNILIEKKSRIISQWCDVILDTYPADAQAFLRRQKDPFSNPVGTTLTKELGALYEELVGASEIEEMAACLDRIIRIRAVQEFTPSKAIGFILQLKKIIRKEVGKEQPGCDLEGLRDIEDRIDDLALKAFDIYVQCKMQLSEIRVNEIRSQVSNLLKMANAGRNKTGAGPGDPEA